MTTGEDAAPTGSAAVDAAIARLRAVAAESGTAGPGEAGSADADVLRTALATLPYQEQRLLWDSHVLGRTLDGIAGALGLHVRAARRRLQRAEEQLARALSAAHARGVPARLCAETRGDLHAYVTHHLGGGRRQALEDHLFGCPGCMRAFIDVREASWALRDAAPVLLAPLAASGVTVPVVVGALGASTSTGVAGWFAALGAALVGGWEWVVRGVKHLVGRPVGLAAGTAGALVAVAAVAMSLAPGAEPAPVSAVATPSSSAPAGEEPVASTEPSVAPTPSATPSATASPSPGPTPTSETTPTPDAAVPPVPVEDDDTPADTREPAPAPAPDADDEAAGPADAVDPPRTGGSTSAPRPSTTPTPDGTEPTTRPTPAPAPSAAPTATPDPVEPEPAPEPTEPVSVSLTLGVGGFGWFQVVPTGGAEIVDVVGGHRTEVTQDSRGRWWVRAVGAREREVTVVVSGPAGSEPGARLSWYGLEH
ncbi:zf-HC2 domain-containing protein [Isoptericola dokdonensis]|uniref:Sigma-70, region 4 n=1 Tax=Isoptericola dokdonensis DS-3 TaxID=1300344 RepID=A0A161IJH6_9MICO|nr:zf-HC2 domain-containing protein [Isoptericola dokdonensis]ANC32184.1 Sigma-70, region 4 [Isoptericola dokdonensis DS-3]